MLILTIILSAAFLRDCFTVDKCLDGGGKWNEHLAKCEFE